MVIAGEPTAEKVVHCRAVQNAEQVSDVKFDTRLEVHNVRGLQTEDFGGIQSCHNAPVQ
jgi:hypothetical protein